MLTHVPPTDAEVESMTPRQVKTYESKVRRAAKRQGLVLVKSRRRDPNAWDYGTYGLLDVRTRRLVVGDHDTGFGLSLSEVHVALVEGV